MQSLFVLFFYHPHDKVEMSKVYLIISLSTKIILCQKTTVSTKFVNEVFYEAKGKDIMNTILSNLKEDTLFTDFVKDLKCTKEDNKDESNKDHVVMLIKEYIFKNKASLFTNEEMPRDSRTRGEGNFSKAKMFDIISRFIESLWEGIIERLTHFDKDGTTS